MITYSPASSSSVPASRANTPSTGAGAATSSDSSLRALNPFASVTSTVNEYVPAASGVPASAPSVPSDSPGGNPIGVNTMFCAFSMLPLWCFAESTQFVPSPALMPMAPPSSFPAP